MKRTAFIQALVIVCLLLLSWAVLFIRLRDKQTEKDVPRAAEAASVEQSLEEAGRPTEVEAVPEEPGDIQLVERGPAGQVPNSWKEWIAYLERQETALDMRAALEVLRQGLFSMPAAEAEARLLELLASGVNLETGLRFTVGKGGQLTSAPDLQTLAADWLGQLNPARAASLARQVLEQTGIDMGPDLYVTHLKNYARGSLDAVPEKQSFVRQYFEQLLHERDWSESPQASVAEAFDFAVWLEEPRLIARLSRYMRPGESAGLGHAAAMAIERIVDAQPEDAGRALMDTIGQPGMPSRARAAYLARLDPADPAQEVVLRSYLLESGISAEERETFFLYFPNLNTTFSHNLVSPEISITGMDPVGRLEETLEIVRQWSGDPAFRSLRPVLEETEDRILRQLTGQPVP